MIAAAVRGDEPQGRVVCREFSRGPASCGGGMVTLIALGGVFFSQPIPWLRYTAASNRCCNAACGPHP